MDTTPPDGTATGTGQNEAALLVNAEIRKVAESEILSLGIEAETYGFVCECGCGGTVEVPLAVYDAEGAWLEGHYRGHP